MGDCAGAAHAYSAALVADPRGALGARLNRLVALLGVCAWGDASSDGAALLRESGASEEGADAATGAGGGGGALTAEQARKVRLRSAAALAQLGRYEEAGAMLAGGEAAADDEGGVWWASLRVGVEALARAEALKAQAASAAAAGDLPVALALLAQACAAAPGHLRATLNACSVALATGDLAGAAAAHAAAGALLDGVPSSTAAASVDGEAVVWLLGGVPPRRSPTYAQLRAELDVRGEALAALRGGSAGSQTQDG